MTYKDVMAKLQQRNKNLQFDTFDIIDWCAEVITNHIGHLDYMDYYKDYVLEIKKTNNGFRAQLPCNFYKLDYLLLGGVPLDSSVFRQRSMRYIDFYKDIGKTVIMDFYGIPMDEEGYPEIANDDVADACYWYCLEMLNLDRYLNSDLPESKMAFITDKKERAISEARSSLRLMNKNRLNKINMIIHNVKPKLIVSRGL